MLEMIPQQHLWNIVQLPTSIGHVVWSPDGKWLAGGGEDGIVYLWDSLDGTLLQSLTGHRGKIMCVAWSPDGTKLASVGSSETGGDLFVWDWQRSQPARVFADHLKIIHAVAWGPSEDVLISGGDDGKLRWWEVQSGKLLWVREAHQGTVDALRRSPDGNKLASCGDDGAIMIWDLHIGEHVQTLRRDRPYERLNITGVRGLTYAQKATLRTLGAFEEVKDGE
jgi:WD40 repeat protein